MASTPNTPVRNMRLAEQTPLTPIIGQTDMDINKKIDVFTPEVKNVRSNSVVAKDKENVKRAESEHKYVTKVSSNILNSKKISNWEKGLDDLTDEISKNLLTPSRRDIYMPSHNAKPEESPFSKVEFTENKENEHSRVGFKKMFPEIDFNQPKSKRAESVGGKKTRKRGDRKTKRRSSKKRARFSKRPRRV
jgi:hypothetical protein